MNATAELLNFVYQNSQMGAETLQRLIRTTEDEELKEHLRSQCGEYEKIHAAAREKLNDNGYDEKGIGAFEKLRTYLMLNMETLTDKSASHIAEMLIIGSNMGVINAVKNLRRYGDADADARKLMEKLQKHEEQNIDELKRFLS